MRESPGLQRGRDAGTAVTVPSAPALAPTGRAFRPPVSYNALFLPSFTILGALTYILSMF